MKRTLRFFRPTLVMFRSSCFLPLLAALALPAAQAQIPRERLPQNGTLGTSIRQADLYSSPDPSTGAMAEVTAGRELVVVGQNGQWLRVFANTDPPDTRESDRPEFSSENQAQPISGWMLDKGIVTMNTPHGDLILFGAADAAEQQASVPDPLPGMAEQARLLYRRVYMLFPQSPWAPEAMWRAADIRWQLQKADASTLPSAHQKASYLREQMDEDEMRKIEKYFPGSRWAGLAAFDLIDNKLCGDWQGSEKCPEQESDDYLQYVNRYPNSPKAAEALYDAAWRQASAGDMWQEDGNPKRAQEDRDHARAIVASMEQKFPDSSFTARAADLIYKVDQGIAIYGASHE